MYGTIPRNILNAVKNGANTVASVTVDVDWKSTTICLLQCAKPVLFATPDANCAHLDKCTVQSTLLARTDCEQSLHDALETEADKTIDLRTWMRDRLEDVQ
jgi:hypothetical protein